MSELQRDHKKVEDLAARHANSPRDVQRQVANQIGIGTVGVNKSGKARNAQAYEGNLSSDSGVAKFQRAGMGPK